MRWIAVALMSLFSMSAFAGQPTPGGVGFQAAATPIMEQVTSFHNFLLIIITVITLFVTALLAIVIFRYNAKANPTPATFSHNTKIEVIWTIVPVFILLLIAVFSFPLLYMQDQEPNVPEDEWITIKAQGNQWNWTYTYSDVIVDDYAMEFVSNPIHRGLPSDPEPTPSQPLYLATDLPIVVPVDTYVRVQTSASDVIHAWTVPAFGVKVDAIPGKLNQIWFNVSKEGIYYGQCSELCGKDHAFMPIEVHVVSRAAYDSWLERAQSDVYDARVYLASLYDETPVQLASAR